MLCCNYAGLTLAGVRLSVLKGGTNKVLAAAQRGGLLFTHKVSQAVLCRYFKQQVSLVLPCSTTKAMSWDFVCIVRCLSSLECAGCGCCCISGPAGLQWSCRLGRQPLACEGTGAAESTGPAAAAAPTT
jgi:hypothetical protein